MSPTVPLLLFIVYVTSISTSLPDVQLGIRMMGGLRKKYVLYICENAFPTKNRCFVEMLYIYLHIPWLTRNTRTFNNQATIIWLSCDHLVIEDHLVEHRRTKIWFYMYELYVAAARVADWFLAWHMDRCSYRAAQQCAWYACILYMGDYLYLLSAG